MKEIKTERIPIWLWSEQDMDAGTAKQAMHLALHPYTVEHIAIMPDCLTDDTEVLTEHGFKKISSIAYDDMIANIEPVSGNIFFAHPVHIINRPIGDEEVVYSFHIPNIDKSICMTGNHRTAIKKNLGMVASELPNITEIRDYVWGGNGITSDEYRIPDEFLCLIAWVVGDGNIKKSNMRKNDGKFSSMIIRFGVTKERKILRICDILDALEYKYHIRTTSKQTAIELNVESSRKIIDVVGINKEYPVWFLSKLSKRQAKLFLDEAIRVDGDYAAHLNSGSYRFNTSRQSDTDFLSALIAVNCGIAVDRTRMSDGFGKQIKMHYIDMISNEHVLESKSGYNRGKIIRKEIDYKGNVVCVTCDTGFFIARQHGLTFVTGNCHVGYGMPIGGVCAANCIIPEAVGVDVGCGMHAVKTSITNVDREILIKAIDSMKEKIPVGFNHNKESFAEAMPEVSDEMLEQMPIVKKEWQSATHQIGTLGGGNHFCEVQKGNDGNVWLMVHSGSRNLGKKVADHYIKEAEEITSSSDVYVPSKWELAYLPLYSPITADYLSEMKYCLKFAKASRGLMMDRMKASLLEYVPEAKFLEDYDIHHNYASLEQQYDRWLWIHRKGATSASKGEIGIIPGSMGTASYIVRGRGNMKSFMSCSHGSGRTMGREVAKKTLDLEKEMKIMDDQGIIHGMRSKQTLDEAPGSYKDINMVINSQLDLIEPIVKLTPLAVIKDPGGGRRR